MYLNFTVCFHFTCCYQRVLWFCRNGAKRACLCVRVMKGGKSRRAAASLMHFESGPRNRHEAKKQREFVSEQQPLMNWAQRSFTPSDSKSLMCANYRAVCHGQWNWKRYLQKSKKKKTLSWTSWVMQPFSEGNKTLSATSESLLQFFPFQKEVKKAEKGGDVALWPICSPYVWLQPLSFNPSHVFIFNGI